MNSAFCQLAFTPSVLAAQEKYNGRSSAPPAGGLKPAPLGPDEAAFIADRDSFYLATVSETGWPYIQHRGGPRGFLRVLDDHTLGFADFGGNRQLVTVGNLAQNDRVALFLMDYDRRERLKLLGHARVLAASEDAPLATRLTVPDYRARIERLFLIDVVAFDWNCPQHITPRGFAGEPLPPE
jgi:predicted pyridoxine 5'-phosphate oxidase superfamily flavin-nucleotide-binding protein